MKVGYRTGYAKVGSTDTIMLGANETIVQEIVEYTVSGGIKGVRVIIRVED